MSITPAKIRSLVENELARLADQRVLQHIRSLLVEPTAVMRDWDYGAEGEAYQAKREDEMQAVADALSLLANIVMAWNTAQMQSVFDKWGQRRSGAVPPELIGCIAPTWTERINMRGVFRFPIEKYAAQLLPSGAAPSIQIVRR